MLLMASAVLAQTNDAYVTIHLADGQSVDYKLADVDRMTFEEVAGATYHVSTIAGSGKADNTPGKGLAAGVRSPQGMAFAPDGSLWICSQNGHVIQRMTADYEVSTVAIPGATLNAPWGCAFDKDGKFVFANKAIHTVLRVAADGSFTEVLSAADWKGPMGVAVDAAGALYVADRDAKAVRKIGADGKVVASFDMSDCKQGPCGVAADAKGNVYVVNGGDYKMFMFTPDGTRSILFGNGVKPTADTWSDGEPGDMSSATMGQSFSVTIGSDGTMYIPDLLACVVRAITPDASGDYSKGTLRTIAGIPFTKGKADGLATEATFNALGTVVEHDGKLYVADNTNNLIRLITKK